VDDNPKKQPPKPSVGRISSKFPAGDDEPKGPQMLIIKLGFKCKNCGRVFPVEDPTGTRTVTDRQMADDTVRKYADEVVKDNTVEVKCSGCEVRNRFTKTDLGHFDA
jgi:hypothetical protein